MKILILCKNIDIKAGGVPVAIINFIKLFESVYKFSIYSNNGFFFLDKNKFKKKLNVNYLKNFDIYFFYGCWSLKNFYLAFYLRIIGKTIIYSPKGQLSKIEFKKSKLFKILYFYLIESWQIKMASKVWLTSDLEKKELNFKYNYILKKIIVSPEFFYPNIIKDSKQKFKKKINIVTIANFSERKNLSLFIKIFKILKNNNFYNFYIIGDAVPSYKKKYLYYKSKFSKEKNIHFYQYFSQSKLHTFLHNQAHILLVTSKFESFGLTVLEAISNNCAIFLNDKIGCYQYIKNHPNIYKLDSISKLEDDIKNFVSKGFMLLPSCKYLIDYDKTNLINFLNSQKF